MRYESLRIMKAIIFIYIILFSTVSYAHAEEIQLNTEIELHDWCKDKSTEYFHAKDKTLHNWSASWRIEKNIIDIKAAVEAENIKYIIKCRVKKGLTSKLAVISIAESKKTENVVKTAPQPVPQPETKPETKPEPEIEPVKP